MWSDAKYRFDVGSEADQEPAKKLSEIERKDD